LIEIMLSIVFAIVPLILGLEFNNYIKKGDQNE